MFRYTDEIVRDLLKIERCRARVEGLSLPSLLGGEMAREAKARRTHYSTSIEGNALSFGQVEDAIKRKAHDGAISAELEVINYWDAQTFLERAVEGGRELSEYLIRELHGVIVRRRGSPAISRYRGATPPGYLFAVRHAGSGAPAYIPPEWSDVEPLMGELVDWYAAEAESERLPVPVRAAIFHYQFVTIHPFEDGNGRVARALASFILTQGGYGFKGLGAMEEYYAADLVGYYESLQMGLPANYYDGRAAPPHLEVWIGYFARVMAMNSESLCDAVIRAAAPSDPRLLSLTSRDRKMLRHMLEHGGRPMRPRDLAEIFSVTPRAITKWCAEWCERGILRANRRRVRVTSYELSDEYASLDASELG